MLGVDKEKREGREKGKVEEKEGERNGGMEEGRTKTF